MYDPTPPEADEPQYNPITQNNESPTDEFILDVGVPPDEIEPMYNPSTMEFTKEDEQGDNP